jgi:ubiquinone/menaquinone biosynthesis C-methylase UbiE
MADQRREERLKAVYGSTDAKQLEQAYDEWAAEYDQDLAAFGYTTPAIILGLAARHIPTDAGEVLDAGAGTGIVGQLLATIGYRELVALDLSAGMLEVARKKAVYSALHQAALGGALPFDDDRFAGMVCVGTFTAGHVGPDALDELVRITKPGGVFVYSLTESLYDSFQQKQDALVRAGKLQALEESGEFDPLPAEAEAPMSKVVTYRVL